jgi:hypothetical protein
VVVTVLHTPVPLQVVVLLMLVGLVVLVAEEMEAV